MTTPDREHQIFVELLVQYRRETGCEPGSGTRSRLTDEARRKAREEAAAAHVDRNRRMAADYSTQRDALLARMRGRPDVEVWRAVTDLIARTFGITFVFKSVEALQAEGAGGYAQIALRRAHVPYITDARSFAIVLHEAGHILSEPCDPKAGHDARSDGRWWLCLRCERLAWDAARWQLFPSISRDMWDELRHGLTTYRRRLSSVTSPAEVARVDALTDRLAWHRHKNLQAKFELLRPR